MSCPIIICEDNLIQLKQLGNIIQNYILFHNELLRITLKTQNPQEVKDYLIKSRPKNGIYFLDIDLNHYMNGIDLAELIRKYDVQAKIIFITTHDELAPITLKRKVEAIGFISKDQSFENYRSEIMELLSLAEERIVAAKTVQKKNFMFSIGSQIYNIDMSEIIFLEPSIIPHRVVLYTTKGQYEFYDHMNKLEEKYLALFRVSRSCLANLNNIKSADFSKRILTFKNGLTRTFSRGKSKKIKKRIEEYNSF